MEQVCLAPNKSIFNYIPPYVIIIGTTIMVDFMTDVVKIGDRYIGDGKPTFITAEIGINHNGDINIAKKLIDIAKEAGCDAVKFQKRTIDVVYTKEELSKARESPFGTTNGELKRALEFDAVQYKLIDQYCKEKDILWYASPWDEGSVDFLASFNVPTYKIASASLTDDGLLKHIRSKEKPVILSTGMSTMEQIDHAVSILGTDDILLMHTTSTYPSKTEELNLRSIETLKKQYNVPVGYSGHEVGVVPSVISVVLGACAVERHITLDRAMWGSDQAASLEPQGLERMVRDIRQVPILLGDGNKIVFDSEVPIIKKLRRKG
jgi:N-acetylneuraminate synthase